jgi:arginine decarboxylase-like protein
VDVIVIGLLLLIAVKDFTATLDMCVCVEKLSHWMLKVEAMKSTKNTIELGVMMRMSVGRKEKKSRATERKEKWKLGLQVSQLLQVSDVMHCFALVHSY